MVRHNILLVDDDVNCREGLRRAFRREPYEVLLAENARVGLRVMETCSVDVVISDEAMPGMSGTTFLARVRSEYPDTIRILLTGHSEFQVAIRAINQGEVYRFFTKPCDVAELAVTIRQALRQKDLVLESGRLLRTVRRQAAVMEELEGNEPGITRVDRDASGTIIVDDVPTDLDALLKEVEDEITAADARLHARRSGAARRGA